MADEDKPRFNYLGPKVIRPSENEKPVTILTANTIGNMRSRRLFRVLLDSRSTVSMIKMSCLRNLGSKFRRNSDRNSRIPFRFGDFAPGITEFQYVRS
jgi:hypothetical protein